jgi:hypothetical protein
MYTHNFSTTMPEWYIVPMAFAVLSHIFKAYYNYIKTVFAVNIAASHK